MGDPKVDPGKDGNKLTNKTTLVQVCNRKQLLYFHKLKRLRFSDENCVFAITQKKVLDHLLLLGVESQWAPVPVRCAVCKLSLLFINHAQIQTLSSLRLISMD